MVLNHPLCSAMWLTHQTAPLPSHIMTHPELADTFEAVATDGLKGFYTGRIAQGLLLSLAHPVRDS
jgi:gamma-glutamyltranspeptidase/glutathione hydrolase